MYSLGAKLFVSVCRSTSTLQPKANSGAVATYLYLLESYWSILNLSIFAKGKLLLHCISNLPLGVTNEGREAIKQSFLAPLPGTPLFEIGELHTIFYLCFLVLLVYLSVFALVSFIENHKNSYLACLLLWVPPRTPSCVTSLVITTMTLSAHLLLHLPLQHLLMKLNLFY